MWVLSGLVLSREAGSKTKPVTQCHSLNDCKLEGCPCVNGICRCDETSVEAEAYSRMRAQLNDKEGLQCFGNCKCKGTEVEAETQLP